MRADVLTAPTSARISARGNMPKLKANYPATQARFQQKQLQEKEQKLLQLYDQQQQRAYQVVQRGSAGSNGSNHGATVRTATTTTTTHTTSTSQGGKVRQMFDERRQTTVKGIDRSYPLEPLENRLRRQTGTNGNVTTQRNGNSTVNRQSVSVRRVARADVNSNVNGGKPVVTYHEEITRESFGPPVRRHDDEDEFGAENRVAAFANGHYRHDADDEQEELLDTIERNRMMAKVHLMGYDQTLKNRVRNDLESEEFPDYLMVDVPERLPKRNPTKKLSQAEARLERFKNANAKRGSMPKQSTSTSTVIKKRSEQIAPARSNSGRSEAARTSPSGAGSVRFTELNRRTLGSRKTVKSRVADDAYKKNSDVEIFGRDARSYSGGRSAKAGTTLRTTHPGSNDFGSPRDGEVFGTRSPPRFFCRESERSATTVSVDALKSDSSAGSPLFYYRGKPGRRSSPPFFLSDSERSRSGTIGESDSRDGISSRRSSPSPRYPFRGSETAAFGADRDATGSPSYAGERDAGPQFYCKESERSATTMSVDRGVSELSSYDRAPERGSARPRLSDVARVSELSGIARGARPQFFCRESERSATTMSIDRGVSELSSYDRAPERGSASPRLPDGKSGRRSAKPPDVARESELSGIARGARPQFFCRESERSATTTLIEPRPAKSILKQRNYGSSQSSYERPSSLPGSKKASSAQDTRASGLKGIANKNGNQYVTYTRRSSKISETSASTSSIASLKYSLEFDNILQSAGLVRKFIRSQDGKRRDGRRSPARRDVKNAGASKGNKPKSGFDTRSLSLKARSPSAETRTRVTPESPRKSVTPLEVDTEIQEIIMTDHRIESDKSRGATAGEPKRRSNGTYTRSPRAKTEPCATYPVRKTRKQRTSILGVFESKGDFAKLRDHRVDRVVGHSTESSRRINRHEETRLDRDKHSPAKDEHARREGRDKIVTSSEVNDQINAKYRTIVEHALSGGVEDRRKSIRSFGRIADKGGFPSRKTARAPTQSSALRGTIPLGRGCGRQHNVESRVSAARKTEIHHSANVPRSSPSRKIAPEGDRHSRCFLYAGARKSEKSSDEKTRATRTTEESGDAARRVSRSSLTRREDTRERDYGRTDSVESALRRFDSVESGLPRDRASPEISLRMMDARPRAGESSASDASTVIFVRVAASNKTSEPTARSPESGIGDRGAARKRDPGIPGKRVSPPTKLTKLGHSVGNERATRPTCRRRLFASDLKRAAKTPGSPSEAKTRKKEDRFPVNRESRKNGAKNSFGSLGARDREIAGRPGEETPTVSVRPLRSIEDIRKSIYNERGARITKESRSAIASRRSVWRDGDAGESIFGGGRATRPIKAKSRISRITKSASPDPAARKHETNTRTTRGSVSSSPSKSPDVASRRASTESKNQDAKPSRKSGTAKGADLTGGKTAATGTLDAADGVGNDLPHESATKKSSAFVIDFNGSSKEDDTIPPRKSPMKKISSDKQIPTTNTGRPSSSSNSSVSLSQLSSAKDKMIPRTRTSTSDLVACKTCGRHFAQDRISLHQQICEKTLKKERKKFDAVLFRTRGTDLEPFVKKGFTKKQEIKSKKQSPAKSDWRRKHEEFISAIRYAKQAQAYEAAGKDLRDLPPPPPSDTSDYIQCPHCNRKFNQAAAERHIPKCKDMLHNKPRPLRPRR